MATFRKYQKRQVGYDSVLPSAKDLVQYYIIVLHKFGLGNTTINIIYQSQCLIPLIEIKNFLPSKQPTQQYALNIDSGLKHVHGRSDKQLLLNKFHKSACLLNHLQVRS